MATHYHDPTWAEQELPAEELLKRCTWLTSYSLQESISVLDPTTLEQVPNDGKTIGEIMSRGNITMKGYLQNEKATNETFEGGYVLRYPDKAFVLLIQSFLRSFVHSFVYSYFLSSHPDFVVGSEQATSLCPIPTAA
jgi:acyl-CoA synthetase (AMP-forming)/AMP-acid ligase II